MEPLLSMYFVTAEVPIGTREKTAVKGDGSVSSKSAYDGSLQLLKVPPSVIEGLRSYNIVRQAEFKRSTKIDRSIS